MLSLTEELTQSNQTHADVEEKQRARLGITPTLLRLSVGLEDPADLIADLQQALGEG